MMAPVRPSTRPRYSGSTLVWIRAMNTELKKGADRPISRDRPANARKPEGGSKPASTRVSPSPSTAAVMVMILFRVPPHRPRSTDPASIPAENRVSTRAAAAESPPKYSMLIRGNRADTGRKATENRAQMRDSSHSQR